MTTPNEILKTYWGYDTFRTPQLEIINSVVEGKDVLAILPTGGGKSVCFQVPALLLDGLCLVITPLIALMKDQVYQLKERNIRAGAVFTGMSYHETETTLDNAQFGLYKFLYVSPERLKSEKFIERLKNMKIGLLAIDEAHCISQWGYDFRPTYLEIAAVKKLINPCPIIALTATATPKVQLDIMNKLEFRSNLIFSKSFIRSNLSFVCRKEEVKFQKTVDILKKVPGSAIVYARNRKKTAEISDFLLQEKIPSSFYHAGLKGEERSKRQENWILNKTRVICSTNAFGMGIDKSDVRTVIHIDLPDTIEAYYQEAGRAGRDRKKSYAVLLYKNVDITNLKNRLEKRFPEVEEIKKVYDALCNYLQIAFYAGKMMTYPFDLLAFCKYFHLEQDKTFNCLKILEDEGKLVMNDGFAMPSKVKIIAEKGKLYRFQVENPIYEPIIKSLLRNYGGILEDYVKINEQFMSTKLKMDKKKVRNDLIELSKLNILRYSMQTDEPKITFLEERLQVENLRINNVKLLQRKEDIALQMNAFVDYITNETTCRQVIIANYFGEKNAPICGICDNCLEKKAKEKLPEYDLLAKDIFNKLEQQPLTLEKLVDLYNGHLQKASYIAALRFMMDENIVKLNARNELEKV
jgi:ATP-dependent DNA helicase RecQ